MPSRFPGAPADDDPGLRLRRQRPQRRRRARRRVGLRNIARRAAARRRPCCRRSPRVLQEAGVDRRALSMIAVTVGPGSFTGVRVGLAAARGLALALDVPLAGITTTAALLAAAEPGRPSRRRRHRHPSRRLVLRIFRRAIGRRSSPRPRRLQRGWPGRPCSIVGPQAEALGAAAAPMRLRSRRCPIPVVLARLASVDGVEGWRDRNRTEGLPRPLYLRGVNVTSPDGTRRTVEMNERALRPPAGRRARSRSRRRAPSPGLRAAGRASVDAPGHGRAAGLARRRRLVCSRSTAREDGFALWRTVADEAELLTIAVQSRSPAPRPRACAARLRSSSGPGDGGARASSSKSASTMRRRARFIHRPASSRSVGAPGTTGAMPALPMRSSCVCTLIDGG